MYWYKVKSMLIILFLIINVFLIGTITFRAYRDIQTENQLEESVVNVLSKNNISLSAKIPKTKENMSIYPVTNLIIDDTEFAKKVLMGEIETSENGVYTLGNKKITISKGVFDYTNDGVSGELLANEEILQKTSQQLYEMGFDLTNAKGYVSGAKIYYDLYFGDKRLFVNNLMVETNGTDIKHISGYWVTNGQPSNKKYKIRPAAEALIEFLRDPNKPSDIPTQITHIELGYSILLGNVDLKYKTAEAVPTYEITINTGKTYYFDARSD